MVQPPPNQENHRHQGPVPQGLSWGKVLLVAFLGGLALFLQATVWTLQMRIQEKQAPSALEGGGPGRNSHFNKKGKRGGGTPPDDDSSSASLLNNQTSDSRSSATTVHSSTPAHWTELHTLFPERREADTGQASGTAAEAYWQQALAAMSYEEWKLTPDPFDDHQPPPAAAPPNLPLAQATQNLTERTLWALYKAADLGHPKAQYLMANAYASGFWSSLPLSPTSSSSSSSSQDPGPGSEMGSLQRLIQFLDQDHHGPDGTHHHHDRPPSWWQVQDTWLVPLSRQQNRAWLWWHMAAMHGHVEAAMTLASRMEAKAAAATSSDPLAAARQSPQACQERLAYWAAAAHATMDLLEVDRHSRAKVRPAKDRHVLYQIHLHGGTRSKLDDDNRPDESAQALEFIKVKAGALSSLTPDAASAAQGTDGESEAAVAAYTLARYYHYGLRGTAQNLTQALAYYAHAAHHNHWEAAGQAGTFYLWGMGCQANPYLAHRYFQMGLPFGGIEACRRQYNEKATRNKDSEERVSLCDAACLNGMGLLRMLGLPHVLPVDPNLAEEYFKLARDQGHIDAFYNLAMMKLGWKRYFLAMEALPKDGQTKLADVFFPYHSRTNLEEDASDSHGEESDDDDTESKSQSSTSEFSKGISTSHPTLEEYKAALSDLVTAASKDHLQARHRLGMIYEKGITIPSKAQAGAKITVESKDCEKASRYYKGLVGSANPQLAWRVRRAYKQYVAGDLANSLRNYLIAAECGSDLAQLNAAFLMERGECLGLSRVDCAKASVRLWKAAAAKGYHEASLRVGDFYYYGRFRHDHLAVGPFGWVQYILFPEQYLPVLWNQLMEWYFGSASGSHYGSGESACLASSNEICEMRTHASEAAASKPPEDDEHSLEKDLAMAAHYYRMAADQNVPRANFNLGFLYEWGLGVKQDFPLAKRHYDMVVSATSREGELPVAIALLVLKWHEYFVKRRIAWEDRRKADQIPSPAFPAPSENIPAAAESNSAGRPVPRRASFGRTKSKAGVFMKHLLSWDWIVVLLLTLVLWKLLQLRRQGLR